MKKLILVTLLLGSMIQSLMAATVTTNKVEAKKYFKVKANNASISLDKNSYTVDETIRVTIKNVPELGKPRPWVGIYEAGEDSVFESLVYYQFTDQSVNGKLRLTKTTKMSKEAMKRYKSIEQDTIYELRMVAWVNGKYVTYATKKFTVKPKANNNASISLDKNSYTVDETIRVTIKNVPELGKPRPWVGIYEAGEDSVFESLVYYQFTDQSVNGKLRLTKTTKMSKEAMKRYKSIEQDTIYELRMVAWVNGKYVTYATKKFTVKPNPYKEEIQDSFNAHYEYFRDQMYKRLKKDKNGNNDTYVLYDVQMHMQNAIIYADENADTDMIQKLLTLTMIPFEKKHMTNGKWLNNRYGNIGKEVDLCIAQYFTLLTRVLSAAERHGIHTDLTDREIGIIKGHINKWINQRVNKTRVQDRYMFIVQSAIQFSEYARNHGIHINDQLWKKYSEEYMRDVILPKFEKVNCGNIKNCLALDRTGWANYEDNNYAGYGKEILDIKSDVNPKAMFDLQGNVKHPIKRVPKVAQDVSHARRYNWFFETVLRYGKAFNISISVSTLGVGQITLHIE